MPPAASGLPPPASRQGLRIATWNIEWFDRLFDDLGRGYEDDQPSARYGISRAEQLAALGVVFTAMDADGIMIIEGPDSTSKRSTVRALEWFAQKYGLRARRAVHGYSSETEQEIAFLYDPDRAVVRHDPLGDPSGKRGLPLDLSAASTGETREAPRFDGTFRYDLDTDHSPDTIRFSKPPLELALTLPSGRNLRLIGVHAKSKNPHGATDEASRIRISIENRRKQLAQCIWIRERVTGHLTRGEDVIVLGDFNDGPGLDEFEKLFGRSGVEIVLGQDRAPAQRLFDPHADMALCSRFGFCPTTARFYLAPQKRWFEALLDFVMVSPGLMQPAPEWRIWHPFQDPRIIAMPELREALLQASDHFPVTIDLALA